MLTVRITMEGGVIQDVQCPAGVRAIVHDYDVDGSEEDLGKDETGDSYVEGIWGSVEGPGMTPHVVVVGSPFDGMTVYGPFPAVHNANDWTDCNSITDMDDVDWWVVGLKSPDPNEESESHAAIGQAPRQG
jgi:hypothetical protein